MNDIDAALVETDRAIKELRFRGVEIFTDHNGRPVDAPEIFPLYEKMAAYNLPILLHPRRTNTTADYEGEATSKYLIYTNFGWPYETSLAMARLAFGGPLEKYPTLKIVTHHAGGMIPYFHKRVQLSWDFNEMRMGYRHDGQTLTKSPVDYYRMFYCDTAIQGNTPALMCAYEFFGADHMVFATDTPYDNQLGERVTRETIEGVEAMPIDAAAKKKIYADNARRLLQAAGVRTGARAGAWGLGARRPREIGNEEETCFAAAGTESVAAAHARLRHADRDERAAARGPGPKSASQASHNYYVMTVRPDATPHAMPVWGIWVDARFYFSTGAQSRKARNLAANTSCVVCTDNPAEAVVVEGTASTVGDTSRITELSSHYARKYKGFTLDPKTGPDLRGASKGRVRTAREDIQVHHALDLLDQPLARDDPAGLLTVDELPFCSGQLHWCSPRTPGL